MELLAGVSRKLILEFYYYEIGTNSSVQVSESMKSKAVFPKVLGYVY